MKTNLERNRILDIERRRRYRLSGHREIAEQAIDRHIRRSEDVHHIDEDPSNNSPDNLLVLYRSDHVRIHYGLAPKNFHWPGELEISNCELFEQELDYTIRKQITRETTFNPISRIPKPILTRADLRIMKLR